MIQKNNLWNKELLHMIKSMTVKKKIVMTVMIVMGAIAVVLLLKILYWHKGGKRLTNNRLSILKI